MYMQEKKKSPRNTALLLDAMHIVIGLVIVVLAVITFLKPENNMLMFPVIFFLGAVLNAMDGVYRIREFGRDKRTRRTGMVQTGAGIFLLVLSVVSAVSIWR